MKFSEVSKENHFYITAYDTGIVRIHNTDYTHSLIISPEYQITAWEPTTIDALTTQHIERLCEYPAEILLIGTGKIQVFPKAKILKALVKKNISYEIMHTAAACRTYNVLLSEGRKVTAALFMIEV